jgi:hypothetical protein
VARCLLAWPAYVLGNNVSLMLVSSNGGRKLTWLITALPGQSCVSASVTSFANSTWNQRANCKSTLLFSIRHSNAITDRTDDEQARQAGMAGCVFAALS